MDAAQTNLFCSCVYQEASPPFLALAILGEEIEIDRRAPNQRSK